MDGLLAKQRPQLKTKLSGLLDIAKQSQRELIHPQNAQFFQGFHNYVMGNNLQGTDDQGRDVTMYITGLEYNGKEYLLPAYDPDTRQVITDSRALLEKYKPLIDSGQIAGYDSPQEAEQDRMIFYPQIVGGR